MSENCTHNCETCGESCPSREGGFPKEQLKEGCSVKKVIGIVSGKGGVGKSMVTSMLAVILNRRGYHTAILDADVTGPSIPKAFGIHEQSRRARKWECLPAKTQDRASDIMSVNLLLDNETDPVVWRGPVIAGAVKQFWTDVHLERCGLYVCGYASGNRRRAADRVPVPAGGRHHHRHLPPGAGVHDRGPRP